MSTGDGQAGFRPASLDAVNFLPADVHGALGDVFGPAVDALTLGLYARGQLARRMGRNAAFDHAGNVAVALAVGVVGCLFSQRAVFLTVPLFAALAAAAVLSIPAGAIDRDRARGLDGGAAWDKGGAGPSGLSVLVRCWPLVVFALCVMLFHFANAPLLPLVVADLMRGTGRFNVAQGAVATVQGIGASLSGLAAGVLVDHLGYSAVFLASGAVACTALATLLLAMPETATSRSGDAWPPGPARPAEAVRVQ